MSTSGRPTALGATEELRYVPVSGLAILAFGFSLASVVGVGVMWVSSRVTGKPSTIPLLLIPAVAGFLFAVAARWRIRGSEGALSGLRLASAAWWLAILGGGGYAAYLIATELALREQAQRFSLDWLQKVATGPAEVAFLDVLEPATRRGVDPADITGIRARFSRDLMAFNNHELVRLLQRAGPDFAITPRGIQGWEFAEGGYSVRQRFELRTPEGYYEFMLPAFGKDMPEIGGRAWSAMIKRFQLLDRRYTALGELLAQATYDQRGFLVSWVEKVNRRDLFGAFLDTLSPADRERLKGQTDAPGFREFAAGSLIRVDGKPAMDAERAKYVADLLRPFGMDVNPGTAQSPGGPPAVSVTPDAVHFDNSIDIIAADEKRRLVAALDVQMEGTELMAEVNRLRGGDWRNAPLKDPPKDADSPTELSRFPNRSYRIMTVDIRPSAVRPGTPTPG